MNLSNKEAKSLIDFLGIVLFPEFTLIPKVLKWTAITVTVPIIIATIIVFINIYTS